MSNEFRALSRLNLLVLSINDTLRDAVTADDSRRRGIIHCAHADTRRALNMWIENLVTGMPLARQALTVASAGLVQAAKGNNALARAALLDEALKKIVVARNEIAGKLARCGQEEEVADAC